MPDYELVNISEIISALQLIKEECEKHTTGCEDCPFRTKQHCGITYSIPEKWKIGINYIWRSFR